MKFYKRTEHFLNILRNNDYPTSITWHLNYQKSQKLHTHTLTPVSWNYHISMKLSPRNTLGYLQGRARYTTGPFRTLTMPIPNKEKEQYYQNMHSSQLLNKRSKYMPKTYTIYRLICLKCHNFYLGRAIRSLYIRITEYLNTRTSSFHKHLIKCKNNDNNFSIKIEASK